MFTVSADTSSHPFNSRPWRAAPAWSSMGGDSKEVRATRPRPWSHVGSRLASAFAQCSDDESDAALPADDASDVGSEGGEAAPQALRPAPRGRCACLCAGEVLFMCGHYGWLVTDSIVDHPAAGKNGGRIYVHRRDVMPGLSLLEGDKVVFYLYVDDQGLGAEKCRMQAWEEVCAQGTVAPTGMNPNAAVFVPGMPAAETPAQASRCFLPFGWAQPLVCAAGKPPMQNLNTFALNEAYWSDLSDDSSDSEAELVAGIKAEGDADGDIESNGEHSDSEDNTRNNTWQMDLRPIPRRGLKRSMWRRKAKTGSSGSSSTSVPSDSDAAIPLPPPPGLRHPSFRAPPGLSLA